MQISQCLHLGRQLILLQTTVIPSLGWGTGLTWTRTWKGRSILIAFSENCRYSSLILRPSWTPGSCSSSAAVQDLKPRSEPLTELGPSILNCARLPDPRLVLWHRASVIWKYWLTELYTSSKYWHISLHNITVTFVYITTNLIRKI